MPRFLDIKVEGVDQNQIFRALMCLFLGVSTFWAVAAFKPDWQRVAPTSRLLYLYLAMEISGGLLGFAALAYTRKSAV